MNSRLLVNTSIRSGNEDVDDYIELLEGVVTSYTTDNATRLLAETNRVIGIIADDMSKIAEDGSVHGTKIISGDKDNLIMDRIVLLMKQTSSMLNISKKSVDVGKKIAIKELAEDTAMVAENEGDDKSDLERAKEDLQDEKDTDLINGNVPAIEVLMKELQNKR